MDQLKNGQQEWLDLLGQPIVIDEEFARLAPPLAADERDGLERSLLAEGCRDPLIVWHGILLDGHNRFRICTQHGIPFKTVDLDLRDRQAALDWIIRNPLNRRNITAEGISYLRGRRFLAEKQSQGGCRNRAKPAAANDGAPEANRQVDGLNTGCPRQSNRHSDGLNRAQELAREYKVAIRTIERDAQFAAALDRIAAHCGDLAKQLILSRDAPLTRKDVRRLALLGPDDQRRFLQDVLENGRPSSFDSASDFEPSRITLPVKPVALAEALLAKLGGQRAGEVLQALTTILQDARANHEADASSNNGPQTSTETEYQS